MTRAQLTTALVLITVICLGLSALLLPEAGDRTPTPVQLISFPPSGVMQVRVELADTTSQQLSRLGPDVWEMTLPSGGAAVRWPASTERVRAFLRILGRLRGLPADDAGAAPAAIVTITSESGEDATLGVPGRSLGGRAIVRVTPGGPDKPAPAWFLTTDELNRLLTAEGILQWLDRRAFAGIRGQVTEITVTSAGGSMTIARHGNGWWIESPFGAPAEPGLITELVDGLRTLPIADPSTNQAAPLPGATAIILASTTRRTGPDGSIVTETARHTLHTLGPVTGGGRVAVIVNSQASDGTPTLGPLTASIDAARLAEIVREPAFYITRRATTAQPADIRSLALTLPDGGGVRFARSDAGWSSDDGSVADVAAIDALVALLTQTDAVLTANAPELAGDAQRLASITAHGLGGLPIASVDLIVTALPGQTEDTRAYALLQTGEIARYYAPESAVDAVRWVAGLEGPP